MKISLFQGILFGVFGIAALIGLFVFATYTSNSGGGTNGVGTVVVWGTLPKAGMDAVLAKVVRTNTDLKSVSYEEKDPATLKNDLASAIATGAAPDLLLATQEELHSLAKFITPIPNSTVPTSVFSNAFVGEGGLFAAPDGYYGLPFLVDPLVLFSNRTILSSDSIAKPPATWEELTGLVPRVARLTPSRQITRSLIALGTYDNVQNARGILSALFIQASVPISSYSPGGSLSSSIGGNVAGGIPAAQAVLSFYTQFADPSKVSYTWNTALPNSQHMFIAGNLALYLGYASEARFLKAANPNLDFNVTPLPQPATAATKSTYGLVYAFMIPNGAKNSAGAYQAAALLTNPAEQDTAAAETGLAPAVLSQLASAPPADPFAGVAYAGALYSNGWLSPAPADTDRVFSGMINDVISGRSTIANVLIVAAQSLNALLQQQ